MNELMNEWSLNVSQTIHALAHIKWLFSFASTYLPTYLGRWLHLVQTKLSREKYFRVESNSSVCFFYISPFFNSSICTFDISCGFILWKKNFCRNFFLTCIQFFSSILQFPSTCHLTFSVTRWAILFFNIWPFTPLKLAQWHVKSAKFGSNFAKY